MNCILDPLKRSANKLYFRAFYEGKPIRFGITEAQTLFLSLSDLMEALAITKSIETVVDAIEVMFESPVQRYPLLDYPPVGDYERQKFASQVVVESEMIYLISEEAESQTGKFLVWYHRYVLPYVATVMRQEFPTPPARDSLGVRYRKSYTQLHVLRSNLEFFGIVPADLRLEEIEYLRGLARYLTLPEA